MRIRGSVVSLSFIFPHPPRMKKKKKKKKEAKKSVRSKMAVFRSLSEKKVEMRKNEKNA